MAKQRIPIYVKQYHCPNCGRNEWVVYVVSSNFSVTSCGTCNYYTNIYRPKIKKTKKEILKDKIIAEMNRLAYDLNESNKRVKKLEKELQKL